MIEYTVKVYNSHTSWYVNGKLHRECDLPAIECTNGYKEWWLNGERHRENNKPAIEYANGRNFWFLNGLVVSKQGFLETSFTNKCETDNSFNINNKNNLTSCYGDDDE